jgi:hypothetical protein
MNDMFVSDAENKQYPICPSGTHFARCWQIIDLGTQKGTYDGKPTIRRMIRIAFEIPSEPMEDGRPFSVDREYNFTMSPKGSLRPDLEAWRGKEFTDDDFDPGNPKRFNIKNLLGVGATIAVIHTQGVKDPTRTYAKIKSISALPKGSQLSAAVNKPVFLSMFGDNWDQALFDSLPEWTRNKIATSPEYQRLVLGKSANTQLYVHEELDDDVPF